MKPMLALVALCASGCVAPAAGAPAPRRPVVVELFTSEGCSSCPPADRALRELALTQPVAGAEVLPLELHVDYWNDLGWADPFSDAAFSARQASYGGARVYTPQMIVAGGEEFVGSDAKRARQAIARAAAGASVPVALRFEDTKDPSKLAVRVDVGALAAPADVWLALTEEGLTTDVPRGENAGARLVHAPVVRLLRRVSPSTPTALALAPSWPRARLRVVAFVQERGAHGPGRISGAVSARLP